MEYELDISEGVDRIFQKLTKKDKQQLILINKKINQILENPAHFKPLRGDMHGLRRVHIDNSFVLVFEIDEDSKVVRILDYAHHDDIY